MDRALSLKSNSTVFAKDVDYEASNFLLLVCPECKEPVHLRRKIFTTGTSYFAHHVKSEKDQKVCSLRVLGYWDHVHENSGMWISRGQLVEKIQVELMAYFSDQFGGDKEKINNVIKKLIKQYSEYEWIYTDLIDNLASTKPIFDKIRDETTLSNDEGREIVSHYDLAVACLGGSKLHIATQGLLWCSFIVAVSLANTHGKKPNPPVGVLCNGDEFSFCLDPNKYKNVLSGKVEYPTRINILYLRCVSISQRLLIRLLTKWKYPASLKREFLCVSSKSYLIQ